MMQICSGHESCLWLSNISVDELQFCGAPASAAHISSTGSGETKAACKWPYTKSLLNGTTPKHDFFGRVTFVPRRNPIRRMFVRQGSCRPNQTKAAAHTPRSWRQAAAVYCVIHCCAVGRHKVPSLRGRICADILTFYARHLSGLPHLACLLD